MCLLFQFHRKFQRSRTGLWQTSNCSLLWRHKERNLTKVP